MRNPYPAILVFSLALLPAVANAQIFKCKDASGRITVQNMPCSRAPGAAGRPIPVVGTKADNAGTARNRDPAGANWDAKRPPPVYAARSPAPPAIAQGRRLEPGRPARPSPAEDLARKEHEFQQRRVERANEETRAYNQRVMAQNRANACNRERQQLSVVQDGRRVYQDDDKGGRVYLEDEGRAAVLANAQRRVGTACQ